MDNFKQIGEFLWKCESCGAEVKSGIANIAGHWVSCTGKDFTKALLKAREDKGRSLTTKEGDEIRKRHFNN